MPITAHVFDINTDNWQDYTGATNLTVNIEGLRKSQILLYIDYTRNSSDLVINWSVYEKTVDNGFYDVAEAISGNITEKEIRLDHTAKLRVPIDIISGEDICQIRFTAGASDVADIYVIQKLKLR